MMRIKQPKKNMVMACILALIPLVLVLMNGCGSNKGVDGFTITALQDTGGAPTSGADNCYQVIQFVVKNSDDKPVDGIQVELTSDGLLAEHTVGNASCENAALSTSNGALLTTKDDGTISVEFIFTPTATGQIGFIWATSGSATPALWETKASI